MDRVVELIVGGATVPERLASTAIAIAAALLLGWFSGWLLGKRVDDPYARYYARKLSHYVVAVAALVAIGVIWRAFAGRVGLVLGVVAAGLAFAMQEVIGAVAGWFNILSGRIFAVGDRIEMGGVRGDVIDVTPLRTKILEMGSPVEGASWVQGRQYTGRIVSVSNKATFTEPVYNYSAVFDFIWEELVVPIPYDADWRRAESILREEAERISASKEAREAMSTMVRRYPVPRAEVEPRVFARATDNWMELAARFVVPVRTARSTKDRMVRRIRDRLDRADIRIASETLEATVRGQGSGTDE
ncbi:MAG TPA: mechanosensitive ion channel domain-containing protein [Actinomycetota bacterium]|jgi:small-conductance mechanosensitive channel|nr:mechanosensitive ion channel domain-containing protein [Actinomycetota bacterium]